MNETVAIVTGGAGTIGFETASQLAAAGAAIIVNGRDAARCDAAVARLRGLHPDRRIEPFVGDVSRLDLCEALVKHAETHFGRLDHVIHCALSPMPGLAGLFTTTDPSKYGAMMEQAVCAVMYLAKSAIPALERSGGGTIIAFPSDAGKVAAPNQTIVGATRAAVMMFFRSLALEVSASNIRCNCIAPTYVDTPELRDALSSGPHAARIGKAMARQAWPADARRARGARGLPVRSGRPACHRAGNQRERRA